MHVRRHQKGLAPKLDQQPSCMPPNTFLFFFLYFCADLMNAVNDRGRDDLHMDTALCVLCVTPCALMAGIYAYPLLVVWVALGGVRVYFGDRKVVQDCGITAIINGILLRSRILDAIGAKYKELELWSRGTTILWPYIGISGAVLLALLGISHHILFRRSTSESTKHLSEEVLEKTSPRPKTKVFPCRTTHARTFPKRHAFNYSYLLCGFPIVPASSTENGNSKSNQEISTLGTWWLQIRAADYLERGQGELGFYGKLKTFLKEQGVEESTWSYAYLVTAPRFFGYSFNPVSFWYIYSRHHELKRMILEVNNTFGERRVYVLDGSCSASPPRTSGSSPSSNEGKNNRFTDIWMKDFHVSPFNSRKGSYTLKALNPFPNPDFENPNIDNTITLKSSKDHGKIVARVHSTEKSLDFDKFGLLGALRFISGWWWVGFVTFPRIIREAFKLYFLRGLHVWFRPEVLFPSIGRMPTPDEVGLQEIFQEYLKDLVNRSSEPLSITYQPSIPDKPQQIIKKAQQPDNRMPVKTINMRVTTPAFYSRFVHYAHTSEALDRECLFTDEKNRTLWISQPELLPRIVPRSRHAKTYTESQLVKRSCLDEVRWNLLKRLRCAPAEPAYPVTPTSSEFMIDDIRTLPYSDLDKFVRSSLTQEQAAYYRHIVTKMFLAQRLVLGLTEIIGLLDFILRLFTIYFGFRGLIRWSQVAQWQGCHLGVEKTSETLVGKGVDVCGNWWWISWTSMYICACHVYGISKGYN